MHILNRILTCLVLFIALVPLGTYALISTEDRDRTEEALNQALEEANAKYRYRTGLTATQSASKKTIEKSKNLLVNLARQKRELRLKLAALRDLLQGVTNDTGELIVAQERTSRLFVREQSKFIEFVQLLHRRNDRITVNESISGRVL